MRLPFTDAERDMLLANGQQSQAEDDFDPKPVVRLFLFGTGMSWLLTELSPHQPDIAFGLCDLAMGCPELGYVSITEISSSVLPLLRDPRFKADKTLGEYASIANRHRAIIV